MLQSHRDTISLTRTHVDRLHDAATASNDRKSCSGHLRPQLNQAFRYSVITLRPRAAEHGHGRANVAPRCRRPTNSAWNPLKNAPGSVWVQPSWGRASSRCWSVVPAECCASRFDGPRVYSDTESTSSASMRVTLAGFRNGGPRKEISKKLVQVGIPAETVC